MNEKEKIKLFCIINQCDDLKTGRAFGERARHFYFLGLTKKGTHSDKNRKPKMCR